MDFIKTAENLEKLYEAYRKAKTDRAIAVRDLNEGSRALPPEETLRAYTIAKENYIEGIKIAVGLYIEALMN